MTELLRAQEVADRLGIHRTTVWWRTRKASANHRLRVSMWVGSEALYDAAYIEEVAKNERKEKQEAVA